jgi:hypothetical protein
MKMGRFLTTKVVIFNLGDGREGDFYDLAVGGFNLHARSGERLGGLHASHCSAHSPAVSCNNLDVVFAVQRLQRCECLGYFHVASSYVNMPLSRPEVHRAYQECNRKT